MTRSRSRIAHVEQGQIRSLISTNGKIEPVQNFEAHSPLTTTVKRVLVKESDAVRKGQLLVTLDDADARTQAARALTQLKAALAEVNAMQRGGNQEEVLSLDAQMVKARGDREAAQRNLDALKRLQQQGSASTGEVRAAENALAQADAQLNLLQQKQTRRYSQPELARVEAQRREAQAAYDAAQDILAKSNVRAPFDGIVYSCDKNGGLATSGDLPAAISGSEESAGSGVRGRTGCRQTGAWKPNRDYLGRRPRKSLAGNRQCRSIYCEAARIQERRRDNQHRR